MKKDDMEIVWGMLGTGGFVVVSGLLIYGCVIASDKSDREEAVKRRAREAAIEAQLPGCTIKDFGQYKGVNHFIVVQCDRVKTQNYKVWHGKYSTHHTTVEIDP